MGDGQECWCLAVARRWRREGWRGGEHLYVGDEGRTIKDETSGENGTQAILRTQEEADVEGEVPGMVGR